MTISVSRKEQISHPLHITPANDVNGSGGHDGHASSVSVAVTTDVNSSPPVAIRCFHPRRYAGSSFNPTRTEFGHVMDADAETRFNFPHH